MAGPRRTIPLLLLRFFGKEIILAKKVRVLIADNNDHVRLLLACLLRKSHIEIVGEAPNERAIELTKILKPDAIVIDADGGTDAIRLIQNYSPKTKVIGLSMSDQTMAGTEQPGEVIFLSKREPWGAMTESIHRILEMER
jgi:DNA-binding NarL/FixJ family response regulator